MNKGRTPAGPKGWPLLGTMLEARRDPLAYTLRLSREYGDVARFHFGPFKGFFVSHPDGVAQILQDHHDNYDKRNYDYDMLRPFVGEGLITSDGDDWLQERRLLQPSFHQRQLDTFVQSMNRSIQKALEAWRPTDQGAQVIDVGREMNRLALEIISKLLIQEDLGPRKERIIEAFRVVNRQVARRFQSLLPLPLWVPLPGNLAARRAKAEIDRVLRDAISERGAGDSEAVLDVLVRAHGGPSGVNGVTKQVLDEMVTLILAGHETTAALLSWTWYLLDQNPEAARQVREEAREILSGHGVRAEDLPKLIVTERVLKESLRMYPPIWMISRRAKEEDVIRGYRIPAESVVAISPFAMHRDPKYWQEPERFDPQRFTAAREDARPTFAYFPFGGGPRLCIGGGLAMMEAKMVLATAAQRYRLERVGDRPLKPKPMVTLRPESGPMMRVHPIG